MRTWRRAAGLAGVATVTALSMAYELPGAVRSCSYAGGPYEAGLGAFVIVMMWLLPFEVLIVGLLFWLCGYLPTPRGAKGFALWFAALLAATAIIAAFSWSGAQPGQPNCYF